MAGCTRRAKSLTYSALVRPQLEYSCSAWDPYRAGHISQLEAVQGRAARYVHNDFHTRTSGCVTSMVNNLQWDSLQNRRRKARLVNFYKITHDLIAIPADRFLTKADSRTRGGHRYRPIQATKDSFKFSYIPRTITDWNNLPSPLAESFKAGLYSTH